MAQRDDHPVSDRRDLACSRKTSQRIVVWSDDGRVEIGVSSAPRRGLKRSRGFGEERSCARQLAGTSWISNSTVILSPMSMPSRPNGALKSIPKSERWITVLALKPARVVS